MTFTFHPGSEHTMLKPTAPRSTQSKHAFRDLEEAARLISRDMRVTGSEMAKWGELGVHRKHYRTTYQTGSAESQV